MIHLQQFDRSCYDHLVSWVHSAEMLMQFAGPAFTFPLTKEQLDTSLSDANRRAYAVIDDVSGKPVGHAEIYLGEACAYLARILVADESFRGKGIGTEIVSQLLNIVFTELKQPVAMLNVFDWNRAAIRCYEKAGFRIDPGKTAERQVNGKTWTVVRMKLGQQDWERRFSV